MTKELNFGLSFFYRVAIPGAVITAVLAPLIAVIYGPVDLSGLSGQLGAAAIGAFIGLIVSTLDDLIYRAYEGRLGWPDRLHTYFTRRLQRRVDGLLGAAVNAKASGDVRKYNEIWAELRRFPVDDDDVPRAVAPTVLGNVLAGYEEYPWRRYGMDSVFYWPRLWLTLRKDVRDEIDEAWAPADALTYIAGGLVACGLIYLVAGVLAVAFALIPNIPAPLTPSERWLAGGASVLLILSSYLPYRVSLPAHTENGERFKSVFDVYRDSLRAPLKAPSDAEKRQWDDLFEQLQYGAKVKRRQKKGSESDTSS